METEIRKNKDQSVHQQESVIGLIGPGQLIYSQPGRNQANAGPIQRAQQTETVIEAVSVTETPAEIGTTEEATNNNMEEKMENTSKTKNEIEDIGSGINDPELGVEPDQGSSQNHNQCTEDQLTAVINTLDGCLVEDEEVLTSRQAKALATLFTTNSIAEASRVSEIPERTLRRWITQPNFIAAYKEAIVAIKQVYIIETLSQIKLAIQARRDLLENPTQPGAAIKEKVADKIIKSGEKAFEMLTIEERVDHIERLVG